MCGPLVLFGVLAEGKNDGVDRHLDNCEEKRCNHVAKTPANLHYIQLSAFNVLLVKNSRASVTLLFVRERTNTGNSGDEILLCEDLYLWVSSMRNAKRALERLTHSFPRNKMTSPITLTLPIRRMLLMINSVAMAEALQKLLPVMAICKDKQA